MTIITRGTPSAKDVKQARREVVPFIGTNNDGKYSSFGVGYYATDEVSSAFWGLTLPRLLIRTWRAMKMFEHVPTVSDFTLAMCWYAAGENIHESDEHYVRQLASVFEDLQAFDEIRQEVLASLPTADELDAMLNIIVEKGIEIDTDELNRYVEVKELPRHPLITELNNLAIQEQQKREVREAIISLPIPSKESLGALFVDLGISHLLDGPPVGAYGIDWGHLELGKLDTEVKRWSTGEHPYKFDLLSARNTPYTEVLHQSSDVLVVNTVTGDIAPPHFTTPDGRVFIFKDASYVNGLIEVTTVVQGRDGQAVEGTYPVPVLRTMIGQIVPPRTPLHRRLFGRR